jgi:hypothetical protein
MVSKDKDGNEKSQALFFYLEEVRRFINCLKQILKKEKDRHEKFLIIPQKRNIGA